MVDKKFRNFLKKINAFITLLLSIAGYVPNHATKTRTIAIVSSIFLYLYLIFYQSSNFKLAILYYSIAEIFYIGFLILVLRKNGYRYWFVKNFKGEQKGYLAYEGILGFLFFNNAASIGYVASSSPGNFLGFINGNFLFTLAIILFIAGFLIKIWAAKVVSINIYYWKDMFLGKKISKFVITGPYKYFSNPMYGIGQIPAYAVAIFYGSLYGLIIALVNQILIFSFYHLVEKKFIKRVYQKTSQKKLSLGKV